MNYYYKDGDYIYIGFSYNPVIVADIKKNIGGIKYNPANKEWYVFHTLSNATEIAFFLKKYNFEYGHFSQGKCPFTPLENKEYISIEEVKKALKELNLLRFPRDYQIEGIHYILNHGNCINGDAPGLGKTGQMICVVELLNLFPCLVVTPASVKYGWDKEWHKWVENRSVSIIDSTNKKNNWDSDVTVINYDLLGERNKEKEITLKYPELSNQQYESIIFDEIHFAKNSSSIRGKISKKIARKVSNVYGLSGTLILNRPSEIIHPLNILGTFKEMFNNDTDMFLYRYCNMKITPFGRNTNGANNLIELNDIISHNCYIRREKRDVLKDLPPLQEIVIDLPISNKKEYEKAEKDLVSYLKNIDLERVKTMGRAQHLVMLNVLKQLSIKGKMKYIEIFLKEWQEANEGTKLLIFGHHRQPLIDLSKKFKCSVLQGGLSSKEKFELIDKFKNNDDSFLFANIESGGTGIDGLQEFCSNAMFIELPSKPSLLEQAISRIERQGQKDSLNIYYMLSPITIDMKMKYVNEKKKMITDSVNKGISSGDMDMELLKMYKDE